MGSCLTLRNEISEDTQELTKQETLLGSSTQAQSSGVREPRRTCYATWLEVLGFRVMGLVSGFSLANHSDSGSFLVVHPLLSQDEFQQEGFWEVEGHVVSPFDLSQILPVGGGLLVPHSLAGPPAIK